LTKFQEVPTELKKIFKKFQEALKMFGQIPGDSWNSRRSENPALKCKNYTFKPMKCKNYTF
jgi:hypothetical protein